jgi:hypothetical protein
MANNMVVQALHACVPVEGEGLKLLEVWGRLTMFNRDSWHRDSVTVCL